MCSHETDYVKNTRKFTRVGSSAQKPVDFKHYFQKRPSIRLEKRLQVACPAEAFRYVIVRDVAYFRFHKTNGEVHPSGTETQKNGLKCFGK